MQTNTKLFQYVENPFTAKFDQFGNAWVLFDNSSVLSIDGYRKVCFYIYCTDPITFDVYMGKISGTTLADNLAKKQALDNKIHCYDVIGPEMTLVLHGKPNTSSKVPLWVYLIP